jgi:DNA-binding response OmpR family regulator
LALIIVADDEAHVGRTVQRALEGHEVLVVSDGPPALRAVQKHSPDLLLLDITMPSMDGLEVCRRITRDPSMNRTSIVFMTGLAATDDIVVGLQTGADDYVCKPFNARELRARVEARLRNSEHRDDKSPPANRLFTLSQGPFELHEENRKLIVAGHGEVQLTPTELDLFRFLLTHPNELFTVDELLQLVWGYPYGVGEGATVRMHIKKLREKIEPSPSDPQWICNVPHQGYVLKC